MPALESNDPTIDVGARIEPPTAASFLEPTPADIVLCSYPDTMDACAAAWVVYKVAKRDKIAVQFIKHDKHAIYTPEPASIVDRHWIAICEDGMPAGTYGKSLLTIMRSSAGIIKPPIPYRNWKRKPPYGIDDITLGSKLCGVHDATKSLCRSTWEFFCADRIGFDKPPRMLSHIDDYITQAGRYNDSKEIAAAVSSYPRELPVYDKLALACEDRRRREAMVAAGQGILRYIEQNKS